MSSESGDLKTLKETVRRFVAERDWDRFHSPKNISMALIVEAAELVEHFQWLTEKESAELSSETRGKVELEMADILIYLIRLADKLDVDLVEAAEKKIEDNKRKYPVEKVRGNSKKYSDY